MPLTDPGPSAQVATKKRPSVAGPALLPLVPSMLKHRPSPCRGLGSLSRLRPPPPLALRFLPFLSLSTRLSSNSSHFISRSRSRYSQSPLCYTAAVMISSVGASAALIKRAASFGDGGDGPQYEIPPWAYIIFFADAIILLPIALYVSNFSSMTLWDWYAKKLIGPLLPRGHVPRLRHG